MAIREALLKLALREDLSAVAAGDVLDEIVSGDASPALVAAVLTALRMKGETADEVAGFADRLREHAVPVTPDSRGLVDTCGTGGDGAGTFNISTTAAFVVAGAGLPVAKHGNVALTSKSGTADVLEALGVPLDLTAAQVATCIDRAGIGFVFARAFHPAFAAVGPIRKELPFPTIFNLLGPLTNPARPAYQLIGARSAEWAELIAGAISRLGTERTIVVSGPGGCDELVLEDGNLVFVVEGESISRHEVSPTDVGLPKAPLLSLAGGTPEENARRLRKILDGETGPIRDAVCFNAGAALVAAGATTGLRDGVALAQSTIDNGNAAAALERLLSVVAFLTQ